MKHFLPLLCLAIGFLPSTIRAAEPDAQGPADLIPGPRVRGFVQDRQHEHPRNGQPGEGVGVVLAGRRLRRQGRSVRGVTAGGQQTGDQASAECPA